MDSIRKKIKNVSKIHIYEEYLNMLEDYLDKN